MGDILSLNNNILKIRVRTRYNIFSILWGAFLFLIIFGGVLNNVSGHFSFPAIFTILRIGVLLLLFFFTEKYSIKKNGHSYFYLALFFFVFSYLLVSIFQGKLDMGLYYIRLYLESMAVLYLGFFTFQFLAIKKLLNYLKILGALSVLISVLSLLAFYLKMPLLYMFHGTSDINFNWFLGTGKFIYRAGFPIGGPNQLGLFYAGLLILNILFPFNKKRKNTLFIFLLILGLFSSFSKSGILVLLIFYFFYMFSSLKKIKGIFYLFPVGGILFLLFIGLDIYLLEGRFQSYISSLFEFDDGSTHGHLDSIINAINNFGEYFQWGYPKGTVGPRAQLFTPDYINVESSLFLILYDMGLIVATFYFIPLIILIWIGLKNIYQLFFLLAVSMAFMVLPLIHSIEITSLTFLFYLLISYYPQGHFKFNNSPKDL